LTKQQGVLILNYPGKGIVYMNYPLIQWNMGSIITGWIQMSAFFPARGGDIMRIEDKEIKRDEKVEVKTEDSDRDVSCCCVTDPCGCVVVDPCGCNIDPCGCCVETCCC
jgi:hypothetical protein